MSIVGILADDADPMVSVMKVEKAPLESYADIGGLQDQVKSFHTIDDELVCIAQLYVIKRTPYDWDQVVMCVTHVCDFIIAREPCMGQISLHNWLLLYLWICACRSRRSKRLLSCHLLTQSCTKRSELSLLRVSFCTVNQVRTEEYLSFILWKNGSNFCGKDK